MWVWILSTIALADCPDNLTISGAQLDDSIEEARLAFASLQQDAFTDGHRRAVVEVECLGEIIAPDTAASFHRLNAMAAFLSGDESSTIRSFQSALELQPNYSLQSGIAPAGGPLDLLYQRARQQAEPLRVDLPTWHGTSYVNGHRSDHIPESIPSVLQHLSSDGALTWTGVVRRISDIPTPLLTPSSAMTSTSPLVAPPPLTAPLGESARPHRRKQGLIVATIVSGVVAGALFGGSALSRSTYEQSPTSSGRQLTNVLYWGSVGTGTLTLGLGIGTVASR